jgi:hypothetical protein
MGPPPLGKSRIVLDSYSFFAIETASRQEVDTTMMEKNSYRRSKGNDPPSLPFDRKLPYSSEAEAGVIG